MATNNEKNKLATIIMEMAEQFDCRTLVLRNRSGKILETGKISLVRYPNGDEEIVLEVLNGA